MREGSPDVVYSGVILREIADGRVVVVSGYGQTVYRNWSVPPPWVERVTLGGTAQGEKDGLVNNRYSYPGVNGPVLRSEHVGPV